MRLLPFEDETCSLLKKKNHSKSPCKTNVKKFEHMNTGLIVNTSDLN